MKGHTMSLVRNGYAVSGGGFLGALFSALLALAVFGPSMASAQEVKQIRLTATHMQGFIAVSEDVARL